MRLLFKAAIVIFLVMLCVFPSQAQFFVMENPLVGKPAKDFTLKTLSGKEINLSKFRDGNNAIVFFWATWCPHCREQLKQLSQEKATIEKKGIKVILVDVEEPERQVRAHVDKNKIPFDVFLDEKTSVAEDYEIIGVPTFFFINKEGTVKAVEHYLPKDYDAIFTND